MTNLEQEMAFALGTIDGVCVETTGGRHAHLTEDAKAFAEQWLFEQSTIAAEESEIAELMESCEYNRLEALRTIACDRAGLAWIESLKWGNNAPDNMGFSPIPSKVEATQ